MGDEHDSQQTAGIVNANSSVRSESEPSPDTRTQVGLKPVVKKGRSPGKVRLSQNRNEKAQKQIETEPNAAGATIRTPRKSSSRRTSRNVDESKSQSNSNIPVSVRVPAESEEGVPFADFVSNEIVSRESAQHSPADHVSRQGPSQNHIGSKSSASS